MSGTTRNADRKGMTAFGHPPARTAFKPGPDPRRNVNGQRNAGMVKLSNLLKRYLATEGRKKRTIEDADGKIKQFSNAELLAKVIWREAIKGELAFINYLTDRILGKPKESIEHSGSLGHRYEGVTPEERIEFIRRAEDALGVLGLGRGDRSEKDETRATKD